MSLAAQGDHVVMVSMCVEYFQAVYTVDKQVEQVIHLSIMSGVL